MAAIMYFLPCVALFVALAATVKGQDPTICVKYTTAVFGNDTAENELALVQLVVNRAVLGDETSDLPGILAPEGGLLELFNGAGPTTNRGGEEGEVVNFLDGASGLPDNLDQFSNTGFLLTHLYQFFGALLGCTAADYPTYKGVADMYEVHKFMNINKTQNDYFIQQVGLAAASYGVSEEDVGVVASVLDGLFNARCTPPLSEDSGVPSFLVDTNPSICQAPDCPIANETFCPAADGGPTSMPAETPTVAPASGSAGSPTATPSLRATTPTASSPTVPLSLCDKYTVAVLKNNTAENQLALIQEVVNMAVLGNEGADLPGILAADGGLLDLFSGAGPTTNRGGSEGVVVNFLDGAGGLPDNLNATSNTAILLNHLYQFFGALLGCSASDFPSYEGVPDMYEVHKFMNINKTQNDYFIQQVGGAAAALGVTEDDVGVVASVLDGVFNKRCTPPLTADSGVPEFMVGTNPSICQAMDCPVADEASCETDGEGNAPTMAPATPGVSLCDKYTVAVLKNNTAENQLALIQEVVNMAVLGNEGADLPGILAADGGLLDLFSGAGPTTNRGGSEGVVVNFLDGAGGLPDNLNATSNTAILLNHLYQFFGALLGCSASDFPSYEGVPDMYEVHKFMNINKTQNDYFIQQVGGAAAALGVTEDDVGVVASVLDGVFNKRCTPPLTADSGVPEFMVGTNPSICQAMDCPVADEASCETDGEGNTPTMAPAEGTKAPAKAPTRAPTSSSGYLSLMSTAIFGIATLVFI